MEEGTRTILVPERVCLTPQFWPLGDQHYRTMYLASIINYLGPLHHVCTVCVNWNCWMCGAYDDDPRLDPSPEQMQYCRFWNGARIAIKGMDHKKNGNPWVQWANQRRNARQNNFETCAKSLSIQESCSRHKEGKLRLSLLSKRSVARPFQNSA